MSKSKDKIRVSFESSGAAEDVTGSCTVITWGKPERTIVVDCGLSFPEDDMLGVDLVIPDITYLLECVEEIKLISLLETKRS